MQAGTTTVTIPGSSKMESRCLNSFSGELSLASEILFDRLADFEQHCPV